ncbi:hypothetical protein YC2023_019005 [Brassica napus]
MEKRTAPNWFSGKGSLSIFDCDIPLSRDSDILAEMNYTHVDLEIKFSEYRDSDSEYRLKEWGIYCLWLNKEEESDSQLEITNRLCLVSGCERCCLVVEYDDH